MKLKYYLGYSSYALVTLILFYILFKTSKSAANGQKRPNILFILADDLGWGDVSLHGSQQVMTPNIDVLASNGIVLNNYYVSPICSPSRSALLTGFNPIHTGLQHNVIYNAQPWGLPLKYKILPQYLKGLGYETHIVGKWHQGFFNKQYLPTKRGFDTHFGFYSGHTDYYDRTSGDKVVGYDFRDNERAVKLNEYKGFYLTDILTNKSIDIILNSKQSKKPFFIYLAHNAVHAGNKKYPLQAPQHLIDRFSHIEDNKRRKFVAMVSALDDSVGQVFSALQRADILNDTIIIFSTDNGGATYGTGGWSIDRSIGSNWPLRGAKYTLFEGGIRGFAFIWSSSLKKRYISDHLMHIQDWLPTIYTAIGGNNQDLGSIDGIDMWNILNNNQKSHRKSLLHNIDDKWNVWALRDGEYKLISGTTLHGQFDYWYLPPGESRISNPFNPNNDHKNSIVFKTLKQMNFDIKEVKPIVINCDSVVRTECKPKSNPCLFDVISDPCEYNNLFNKKPNIVKSMLKQLYIYNSSAVKPCNAPNDEKSNPKYHNNFWSVWK